MLIICYHVSWITFKYWRISNLYPQFECEEKTIESRFHTLQVGKTPWKYINGDNSVCYSNNLTHDNNLFSDIVHDTYLVSLNVINSHIQNGSWNIKTFSDQDKQHRKYKILILIKLDQLKHREQLPPEHLTHTV